MAKQPTFSPIMQQAVAHAQANGGKLVRYAGGFWARPWLPGNFTRWTAGETWFSTHTINALLRRGAVRVTDYGHQAHGGRFAVEVTVVAPTPQPANSIK